MAGDYDGPGHKIVSGEIPIVGLRVMTNECKWGKIVEVADPEGHYTCGWYCEAWHKILYDDAPKDAPYSVNMNCDRLTTKEPDSKQTKQILVVDSPTIYRDLDNDNGFYWAEKLQGCSVTMVKRVDHGSYRMWGGLFQVTDESDNTWLLFGDELVIQEV